MSGFEHLCGGVIINEWQLLTAAHCVYNRIKSNWLILAGTGNAKILHSGNVGNDNSFKTYKVLYVKMHEKYLDTEYHDDIAIVTVETPFDLDKQNIDKIRMEENFEIPQASELCRIGGNDFILTTFLKIFYVFQ